MRQAVYALFLILVQAELYRRLAHSAWSRSLQSPSSYSYLPGKILLPLSFTFCHMPAPPSSYFQVPRTKQSSYEQYTNPKAAMLVECLCSELLISIYSFGYKRRRVYSLRQQPLTFPPHLYSAILTTQVSEGHHRMASPQE